MYNHSQTADASKLYSEECLDQFLSRIKSISSPASLIAALSALRFVSTVSPFNRMKIDSLRTFNNCYLFTFIDNFVRQWNGTTYFSSAGSLSNVYIITGCTRTFCGLCLASTNSKSAPETTPDILYCHQVNFLTILSTLGNTFTVARIFSISC